MKKSILLGFFFVSLLNIQSFANVNFIMKNYNAQLGTQITIPVKVTNFNTVMSIQGTVQFDATKLSYVSVQDFTSLAGMTLGGFGITQVTSGKLTFSWMEPSLSGLTLTDSTTIFSIKFNVTGTAGQTTPLQFVNSPTPFEVVDPTMTPISFTLVNGSIHIYTTVSIPEIQDNNFQVYQNAPNPFSDQTRIEFMLPQDGLVRFEVYDMIGNKVADYEDSFMAGNRSFEWSANIVNGSQMSGGTYFYKISCGKYSGTGKMFLVK